METTALQFFYLYLFFGSILFFLVFLIFFSKWQIYGPKFHSRIEKTKKYFAHKFDKSKPKVQKGAVIENQSVIEDLEKKEREATNAQELLAIQKERASQQKRVIFLEKEMETKKIEAENKIKEKEERKQLKEEDKIKHKEYKAQEKERKKQKKLEERQLKNQAKLDKKEN